MKYYVFLEQKNSEEIEALYVFDTIDELDEYFTEAYFPDTWDYRIVEGTEKNLSIKVSVDLS